MAPRAGVRRKTRCARRLRCTVVVRGARVRPGASVFGVTGGAAGAAVPPVVVPADGAALSVVVAAGGEMAPVVDDGVVAVAVVPDGAAP